MPKTPESSSPSEEANPKPDGSPQTPPNDPRQAAESRQAAEARQVAQQRQAAESRSATESRNPEESRGAAESGSAADGIAGPESTRGRKITERKGQFLIAPRKPGGMLPMGMAPLSFSLVEQTLRASPEIEIVDTVGPKNMMGALSEGLGDQSSVLVARMTDEKAGILAQQGQGRLIVERDHHLALLDPSFQPPPMVIGAALSSGPALKATFIVLGKDNKPQPDAEIFLFGSLLPAQGVTDAAGQVTLSVFGETPDSIHSLYVKPKCDHWSFYQTHPELSADEPNIVSVKPLADWPGLANFPRQQVLGWGQKAMRLDHLPDTYRGQGVKVAVVDSGVANSHDDLRKVRFGFDIINKKTDSGTWNVDSIAHGSHCAGVIAGAATGTGIRGFAPDAELHACKLFPGGQVSQLIDALEYCIEKQIDVVNLSLGGAEASEALEQQILRARRAGVACIVAAGNSGGAVQYPASSPNVLAVAAIGRLNEFPPDSYHSQTVTRQIDPNGFFSARFSCYGPQVSVCAPGVAIPSSVPANNYAAWDGTSMAAPHVSGLAALVLAHHPDFQGAFKARNADRVDRLFQIIRAAARPINLGDAARTGFGLPDVPIALGLQPAHQQPAPQAGSGLGSLAASPQNNLGTLLSMSLGRGTPTPQFGNLSMQGYPYAYYESPQLMQQNWMNNPWIHAGTGPGSAQQVSQFGTGEQGYSGLTPAMFAAPLYNRTLW